MPEAGAVLDVVGVVLLDVDGAVLDFQNVLIGRGRCGNAYDDGTVCRGRQFALRISSRKERVAAGVKDRFLADAEA